jgi:branched-chain amino acid transport system ATP-binding protein
MILKTVALSKDFGSLRAVNNVNLEIKDGQIRAIIGPNGAGKTTLLDLITNRTRSTSGRVYFRDREITRLPPYDIVKLGIGKCFQISKLFPELTVFENIQIACISQNRKVYNMYASGSNIMQKEVVQIIESIGLSQMIDEHAGYLSYGDQRRLEIGITLGLHPALLLLDEPTAGVSRAEGNNVMKLIKSLALERLLTIVFIEHDMDIVFNYADEITVMHQGGIIATGTPTEIRNNQLVQDTYLGESVA